MEYNSMHKTICSSAIVILSHRYVHVSRFLGQTQDFLPVNSRFWVVWVGRPAHGVSGYVGHEREIEGVSSWSQWVCGEHEREREGVSTWSQWVCGEHDRERGSVSTWSQWVCGEHERV